LLRHSAISQHYLGGGITRITVAGLDEAVPQFSLAPFGAISISCNAPEKKIIAIEVVSWLGSGSLDLALLDFRGNDADHASGDAIL
jgi:hypothetical protein